MNSPTSSVVLRPRVLVADDDQALLRVVGRALEAAGFEVAPAEDGTRAQELLAKGPFEAVLTDVGMPGLSGLEVLRAVRERDLELLFINLHASDLDDEELASPTAPLAGMATRVVLEITERASLESVSDVRAKVARLREMGFRIAVDDLGAGYAGLTTFALLEPEFVKLDMSLVRDVHRSMVKQKLVRSMTSLCADMGIAVVAEGVEIQEERDAVVDLGCDLLQGYCLAKPGRPFPSICW